MLRWMTFRSQELIRPIMSRFWLLDKAYHWCTTDHDRMLALGMRKTPNVMFESGMVMVNYQDHMLHQMPIISVKPKWQPIQSADSHCCFFQPRNSVKAKVRARTNTSTSAMGAAIKAPSRPNLLDRMIDKGIRNTACREKGMRRAFTGLPMPWKKEAVTICNP